MSERGGLIASNYFESRPDLTIGENDVVVLALMRDELLRLPYFLEYYRALGVDRFLLVDNGSTDGTREYLADQPDVEYFYTDTSFMGSSNGRMWVQEIAEQYATGRWLLFVDIDELFVYPGVEMFGIHDFCRYLDANSYEGVFAVLLDLYSDKPLAQTRYESGTDFRETCRFFELDSYRLSPATYPPFLSVWGGPRGRLLAETGYTERANFQQRKVPLVKWKRGFSFVISAHDARYLPLADVSGALLHFKYFSTWSDRLVKDRARGDRNPHSYAFYASRTSGDTCYYGSHSLRYNDSRDLVRLGVIASTGRLAQFYKAELRARGDNPEVIEPALPPSLPAEGRFNLRSIAALWPYVNNAQIARYFGQVQLSAPERRRMLHDLADGVEVVDVWQDRILLRLAQKTLHRWHGGELAVAVYVNGRLLERVVLDETATTLEADLGSLIPNVFRWNLDLRRAWDDSAQRSRVDVYVLDATAAAPDTDGPRPNEGMVRVYSRNWFHERTASHESRQFFGEVEKYTAGELHGWAFDSRARSFDLPIAIYVDGRLAEYSRPSEPRPHLAARAGCPKPAGRGFRMRLPLGYFRANGDAKVHVDVRIAGLNLDLGQAPFELPTDIDEISWAPGRDRALVWARTAHAGGRLQPAAAKLRSGLRAAVVAGAGRAGFEIVRK